jgi:hypothetical protein
MKRGSEGSRRTEGNVAKQERYQGRKKGRWKMKERK